MTWRTGAYQRQRVGARDYRRGADGHGPTGGIAPNFTDWRYRRELRVYLDTGLVNLTLYGAFAVQSALLLGLPLTALYDVFEASGPCYRRVVRDTRNAEPATYRTMDT